MVVRVVHWGTGNTGTMALKGVVGHPALELVGCHVSRPERVGKDVGELLGRAPLGITTTGSIDAVLELAPDCVSYFGVGEGSNAEVEALLRAGINVVTTSFALHILPDFAPPALIAPTREACLAGGASFFATGVEPGVGSDLVPETLLSFVDEATYIHVGEYAVYRHAGGTSLRIFGFGVPAGEPIPLFAGSGTGDPPWSQVARHLASAIGRTADAFEVETDTWVTPVDIEMEWGTIPAGHVGAIRFQVYGVSEGRRVSCIEHVSRTAYDQAPDWPAGALGRDTIYRVRIEGRPPLEAEVALPVFDGTEDGGLVGTAMRAVNAIPYVVEARPGVLGPMDVPARGSRKNTGA